ERNELLAPEAHAAVAPVARDRVDGRFVDELHDRDLSVSDGDLSPGLWLTSDQTPRAIRINGHQSRSQPNCSRPKLASRNTTPMTIRTMPLLFMGAPRGWPGE